jgi:hypothetical protein
MPQTYGVSYRASLPGAAADSAQKQMRVDQYGSMHIRNELLAWAEEGTYYRVIGSATPMTGTAQAITTSFSATAVPLVLVNGSASVRIIPHYIKLICTAAGSTTTSAQAAISIDSANRYSSGGTDLTGLIVNSNTSLGPASAVTTLRFGTVTASAAGGGTRYIYNDSLKVQAAPCWTVGDVVRFNFAIYGDADPQPMSGSTPIGISKNLGPVVLGGQNASLILHLWNIANATTAPSWAFEMAWWER